MGSYGVSNVGEQLGISEQTLSNWRKAAAAGKLAASGQRVTPEDMEFSRLRTENRRLCVFTEVGRGVHAKPVAWFTHVGRVKQDFVRIPFMVASDFTARRLWVSRMAAG